MAVPFMLGSFSGGLFQGAQSAFSLYQAYQGIQAEQYNLDAAADARKRYDDAMKEYEDQKKGLVKPDTSVQTGDATVKPTGTPSGTTTGPVSPGTITQTALPPPTPPGATPATTTAPAPAIQPQTPPPAPPPVEPGLVPTNTRAVPPFKPAYPAGVPTAADYGNIPPYALTPWGAQGPPYGPMMDPGTRLRLQQSGVSPGVQSDVAAHEGVTGPTWPPVSTTTAPVQTPVSRMPTTDNTAPPAPQPPSVTAPVGGYFGRGIGPQSAPIPTQQPGGPVIPPQQTRPPGYGINPPEAQMPPPGGVGPAPQPTPPMTGPESDVAAHASAGQPGFLARTLASINPVSTAQAGELSAQDRIRMGGAAYTDDQRAAVGLPPLSAQERADFASPTGGAPAAPAPVGTNPNAPVQIPPPTAAPEAKPQGMTTAQPTPPKPGEPPPAPAPVVVPGEAGKVVPGQKGLSLQSEPTPHVMGSSINPGPWARAQRNHPELARMLQDVVATHGGGPGGVTVENAAAVIEGESNWDPHADANKRNPNEHGKGLGQFEPGTQADMEKIVGRPLDPWNPRDNMIMTVEYLKQLGHMYGQGSFAQQVAYMRGTGGVEKANHDWQLYAQQNPLVARRLAFVFGDAAKSVVSNSFPSITDSNTKGPYTPRDLLAAGQQGPDGTLNYLASYGPQNLAMGARWAASQALMEAAAMAHGRYDMIPMIQEAIAMESHQGAMANLASMHQAMLNGDMQAAAEFGARAHAFYPDGSYARFAVDQSGKLWVERFSEGPDHQTLGKPFQVTPEAVYGQMMAMHTPAVYQKQLQEHQAAVAKADLEHAQMQWYQSRPEIEQAKTAMRETVADIRARAQEDAARTRADAARDVANAREAARQEHEASTAALDKDVNEKYPSPPDDVDPTQWANESEVYRRLRMSPNQGGANLGGPTAQAYAKGLTSPNKIYSLQHATFPDGRTGWAIKDKQGNVVAPLSEEAGAALHALPGMAGSEPLKAPAAGVGQQTGITPVSPIGAGAGSMMALRQGYNQNLSGIPMTQAA